MPTTADDWQARALAAERELAELRTSPAYHDPGLQRRLLAAEADVARLREVLERVTRRLQGESCVITIGEVRNAVDATPTPTPPAAVAALVRAARAITTLSDDEPCYGVPKRAVNALAALLDAPPWRDIG